MRGSATLLLGFLLLTALLVVVNITRPLLPIDETRYLTVAWEFFHRGEWVLPTLNYAPYSHKPPMLFWLIDIFWQLGGSTNIWLARLVTLIGSFGSLALSFLIARTLWPDDKSKADIAILMMLATPFFLIYSTLIMFDTLLSVAVLLGLLSTLKAYTTGRRAWWLLTGVALGLGVLIKGPVILVHLLPVILLYPVWQSTRRIPFSEWSLGIIFATFIGVAIGLSWAIPAAAQGGPDYAKMIFWGQSAGRMVQSFDHARPFWFYIALLPALMLPWIYMPALWRRGLRPEQTRTWQTRFLLCWLLPPFIIFMMISGKQVHYLMPLVPAVFLLLAHIIVSRKLFTNLTQLRLYIWVLLPAIALALAFLSAEIFADLFTHRTISNAIIQLRETDPLPMVAALLATLALSILVYLLRHRLEPVKTLQLTATSMVIMIAGLHGSISPVLKDYYDLAPAGEALSNSAALGTPIAMAEKWEGELGYLARLTKPITIINANDITEWLKKNRNGIVIIRHKDDNPLSQYNVIYTHTYRSPHKKLSLIVRKTP
jgi:4-amino-4-deoxy-L-arabinose transferase-like glycosyltransferase